jgi:hypothetical protein
MAQTFNMLDIKREVSKTARAANTPHQTCQGNGSRRFFPWHHVNIRKTVCAARDLSRARQDLVKTTFNIG